MKYWVQLQPIFQPTFYKPIECKSRLQAVRLHDKMVKRWGKREVATNCKSDPYMN
ncbi:MAG: hypothetical protein WC627_12005 [Legionella sp.]|jgi:hypothetical protein